MIFVDSNVLIDLIEPDGAWRDWSEQAIVSAAEPLAANAVVLAETARQFRTVEDQKRFLQTLGIALRPIDEAAAWRAGRAHADYRAAGGTREAILADFLIAGHAAALGATFLTRDRRRVATYFPELELITPEEDNG
ncbi:MAG: type II toxin-antitoxin system VapC family toxin [Allosphingosinicella sp.]|uniref:type II toxin-antitoxin system VapC family toxin n=1 Tax=Allosphingosinicella sp. TaxID=2823234 RepID=UPI003935F822